MRQWEFKRWERQAWMVRRAGLLACGLLLGCSEQQDSLPPDEHAGQGVQAGHAANTAPEQSGQPGGNGASVLGPDRQVADPAAQPPASTGAPAADPPESPTRPNMNQAPMGETASRGPDSTTMPAVPNTSSEPDGQAPGASGEACAAVPADGHFQLEDLDRGLVAVRRDGGNYIGFRMLGYEYDQQAPERVAYRLYRGDELIATLTDSTNYFDQGAPADATYRVSAVIDDMECARSEATTPWARPYLEIPLDPPQGGTTRSGRYAYDTGTELRSNGAINDGSPGDVDGDGQYELVVIWEPSNAQDNSRPGHTGPVYMDCYELDGTRRWRLNLGQNIRAGAHYTQFLVYDLDGDGRAEVAVRTAPGTRDGTGEFLRLGPAADDDDSADYRNGDGYVLSGPEYLTVFEGETGRELATVDFQIARGRVAAWGDDYGNRVDRFLASVAFVSDEGGSGTGSGKPAILMARGYYTRATVTAWTYRDGKLDRIWTADSDRPDSRALAGQGAHSMSVADVDHDGAQEIIYGAAMIDSDGSFGCSTGLGHGDALHVGDLIPSRPGLEVFMPHEDASKDTWDIRDAETCEIIHRSRVTGSDNGRGVAADIVAASPGAEMWSSADDALRSAASGNAVGSRPRPINFLIYWDADELRELQDATRITKGDGRELLRCDACQSNNHTKATPTLTADLFGDWREETIWRTPDSSALRVYTTTDVTDRRIYTLMHDPQYRMQVSAEQTAYNQPPHPGFVLGADMPAPPQPDLHVR
ncbi:MAG: rhamnogalacturonan lyase [Myxococcales bacterium]|nr:rhamnogalacturonan lyase [Myxococcales bacterium]MDD9965802.1 rhamnogalacturonan lyase [Myxococcales bacterium]